MSGTAVAIEMRRVSVRGRVLDYQLHRSARRTLEISVVPGGKIEVRAPKAVDVERIEARMRARGRWLLRKREERVGFEQVEPDRSYVAGESHRYLGRQYRLRLLQGEVEGVALRDGRLVVSTARVADPERVRQLVRSWYLERSRVVLVRRVEAMVARPEFVGLRPARVVVRAMVRRLGSCSRRGRIQLHPILVELPTSLIDFVIAHELCHLRVADHGPRFERVLSRVMPDWRRRRSRLSEEDQPSRNARGYAPPSLGRI